MNTSYFMILQRLLVIVLLALLGCTPQRQLHVEDTKSNIYETQQQTTAQKHVKPITTNEVLTKPLSPYSMDGLVALNQFRTHNDDLNDFLIRNRKPDYFFSGINTRFSYQKVYLVYLKSQNLYLFDPQLGQPYKRFHPLPDSVKKSLQGITPKEPKVIYARAPSPSIPDEHNIEQKSNSQKIYRYEVEKSIAKKNIYPLLTNTLLESSVNNSNTIYPDTYYLDRPLTDLVENSYSVKYDKLSGQLKIIFPQAYESSRLYHSNTIETKRIIFNKKSKKGTEISLIVPDFLAESKYYKNAYGKMKKAFSSLYVMDIEKKHSKSNELNMRFRIKICQDDKTPHCAIKTKNHTQVRAIVISATIYHRPSLTPLETFLIK